MTRPILDEEIFELYLNNKDALPSEKIIQNIQMRAVESLKGKNKKSSILFIFLNQIRWVGATVSLGVIVGLGLLYLESDKNNLKTVALNTEASVSLPPPQENNTNSASDFSQNNYAAPITKAVSTNNSATQNEDSINNSLTQIPTLTKPSNERIHIGRAEKIFQRAIDFENQNDFTKATKVYSFLWENFPRYSKRADVLYRWGKSLEALDSKNEAYQKYVSLYELNPNYPGLTDALVRTKQ